MGETLPHPPPEMHGCCHKIDTRLASLWLLLSKNSAGLSWQINMQPRKKDQCLSRVTTLGTVGIHFYFFCVGNYFHCT